MAINIPIVTEFDAKGLQSAQNAFNNFRTKVAEADGAMGKMKAGFGAAGDYIKANAASIATAAGGALATFALKAMDDFQDLALEVDKFSNVTRIAAEESSRWIEIAGDLGIEAGSVQTAINKMNQSLASSRDEYNKLGVEIARTKDGTIDANETFIRTVDAIGKIKDPAERARVATQLLGKSWTQVSELVEMGAGSLRSALESVSGAKLIDEAEIQRAKDFRAAQDALKDAFENVAIAVGQELLPIMTKLLESLAPVAEKAGWLSRAWKSGFGAMTGNVELLKQGLSGTSSSLDTSINEVTASFWNQQEQMYRTRYEALKLTDAFSGLDEAYAELKGNIDERGAWRNLQDEIARAGELALQAFKEKTPEALRASQDALDRTRLAAADYILKLDDIPEQKKTQIIAGLDQANLADIERQLAYLARPRVAGIIVGPGETPSEVTGRGGSTPRIGALRPMSLSMAPTAGNVTVNVAGSVTTEADLVESIRKGLVNAQRNGAGLVYSNQ
jgi:predicted  nucleic acid-binding Zn-ribbon protein